MTTKTPPSNPVESVQYDLFSQFVTNNRDTVSNTIEIWESIPKYFLTPKQIKEARGSNGLAQPIEWHYEYESASYSVEIQPATIKDKDGSYRSYFPAITEELVEESIKKIFSDQNHGIHDAKQSESWVYFTKSMIKKDLAKKGKTRSMSEIQQALDVMSGCVIRHFKNGKEIWKGAILQDLVTVNRSEYLDDSNARHAARLPLYISHAVNKLEYRQINYVKLMQCKTQLTRWMFKKLVNRYKQASVRNTYNFRYSAMKRDSALLQQHRETDNRKKVIAALDELKESNVIMSHNVSHEYDENGKTIIDSIYTIRPSVEFESEQKAANKRDTDSSKIMRIDARY